MQRSEAQRCQTACVRWSGSSDSAAYSGAGPATQPCLICTPFKGEWVVSAKTMSVPFCYKLLILNLTVWDVNNFIDKHHFSLQLTLKTIPFFKKVNGWEQYPLVWTVLLPGWKRLFHAVGWNEQGAVSAMGWGSQCPHGAFLSFANLRWVRSPTHGVHVTHQLLDMRPSLLSTLDWHDGIKWTDVFCRAHRKHSSNKTLCSDGNDRAWAVSIWSRPAPYGDST